MEEEVMEEVVEGDREVGKIESTQLNKFGS